MKRTFTNQLLRPLWLGLMLALLMSFSSATAQEIFNESFETGQAASSLIKTPWTASPTYWFTNGTVGSYNRKPHTGQWYAYLGYNKTSWLFRQVTLTAGTTYSFSMWAIQDATTDAYLTVKMGTAADQASMTDEIVARTLVSNVYQEIAGSYTPTVSGDYYVGIYGEVGNTPWYVTIDDIVLAAPLANDLKVASLSLNPTGSASGTDVTITCNVVNKGSNTQNDKVVSFKVDNVEIGTQTIATLASGENTSVQLNWTSTSGTHSITASVADDDDNQNNSASQSAYYYPASALIEDFEGATFPSANWELTNNTIWSATTTASEVYEGAKAAKIYKYGLYTDAKIISPKLDLGTGEAVVFYAKSADPYNKVQVQYSTDKSNWTNIGSSMTLTASYQSYMVDLSSISGEYYIALNFNPTTTYTWYSNYVYLDKIILPKAYVSADPEISLSPSTLDWGKVPTGTTVTKNFTITNAGGADLVVTSVTANSPFSCSWSGTITPGNSQQVTVSYSNSNAETSQETLTVSSNATGGTNTISLKATSVAPLSLPVLEGFEGTLDNWTQNFWATSTSDKYEGAKSCYSYSASDILQTPWINLNATNPELILYRKCAAAKKLTISISEDGTNFVGLYDQAPVSTNWEEIKLSLSAYASKKVTLRFATDANQSYTTTYIDNLLIQEAPTDPVYYFSESSISYGTILVGSNMVKSVYIQNAGAGSLEISKVAIEGTDAAKITLPSITFPASLAASEKLSFDITFTPTDETDLSAELVIEDNNANEYRYPITGKGFDAEIKTLPFTENFDALTAPSLPAGWSKIINSSSTSTFVGTYNSATYASSQPNSVKLYGAGATGANVFLILPYSKINLATTVLKFKAFGGSNANLEIGYLTNPADASTFHLVKSLAPAYGYADYSVNMSEVNVSGSYSLAFRHASPNTYTTFYIDNISWEADITAPVASLTPADGATNVNPYQKLIIDFSENILKSDGTAFTASDVQNLLVLKETDENGASVAYAATVSNKKIELTPSQRLKFNQLYYVAVNELTIQDAAGNKNAAQNFSFTTSNPTLVSVPYSEGFEGSTFVPDNWSQTRTKWIKYAGTDITAVEGTACATYYAGAFTSSDSSTLVSPVIDISSLQAPILNLSYKQNGASYWILTSYDLGLNWDTLIASNTTTEWVEFTEKLETGKEFVKLMFKGKNGNYLSFPAEIYLDGITIEETPADPIYTQTIDAYNFSQVILGETASHKVTVSNTGGQSINIASITLEGANADQFSISAITLPVSISTNNLEIEFNYIPSTGGTHSANLIISEDNGTSHTVALSGTCIDTEIKTIPWVETFDTTPVNQIPVGWKSIISATSTTAYVHVSNNGTLSYSVPNELRIYGGNKVGTAMAIIPSTKLDLSSKKLKFIARGGADASVIVGYLTDPTDEGTFQSIETVAVTEYANKPYEVNLTALSGTTQKYLAFKHGLPNSYQIIYLDNVRISANQSPVFTSQPITGLHAGNNYQYNIVASDADNNQLTFAAKYLPTWLTLTDNGDGTATIKGTTVSEGYHNVTISVSDGEDVVEQKFTILVSNNAPVIVSKPITTAFVGEEYQYQVSGTDNDNDNLVFGSEALPAWLSLTDNQDGTALLKGTPVETDTLPVTLTLSDGLKTVKQTFELKVQIPKYQPEFVSQPYKKVMQNQEYSYTIEVNDKNTNDELTISASKSPEWLTLSKLSNTTAKLSGTPTEAGNFEVILMVSDGELSSEQTFTIEVTQEPNTAPVFTSSPIISINEHEAYLYSIEASDVNADQLVFFALQKPQWLLLKTAGSNKATLEGTAKVPGKYAVILGVSDGIDTTKQEFEMEVIDIPNDAPQFVSSPALEVLNQQAYAYNVEATDLNNNTIALKAFTLPSWLTFNDNGSGKGVLKGTAKTVGKYTVILGAIDVEDTTFQQFEINVLNNVPVFTSVPVATIEEKAAYSYSVTAKDTDNDALTFFIKSAPQWLSIAQNKLTGTAGAPGEYNIALGVTDGKDSIYQEFKLMVTAKPNNAPKFTSIPLTTIEDKAAYVYSLAASDADNDALTFFIKSAPQWLSIAQNKLSGTADASGEYNIALGVTDGKDSSYQEFKLTVTVKPNNAPNFTSVPLTTIEEKAAYVYSLAASDADNDALTFFIKSAPQWLSIAQNKLSGTAGASGEYNIALGVTDGKDSSYQEFKLKVTAKPNNVPEFTSVPEDTAFINKVYIYNVVATDNDNDELTLAVVEKPEWLSFSVGTNGQATLTGTPSSNGLFNVKLIATDGKDTTYQAFTINAITSGIGNKQNIDVNIYPNPFENQITVTSSVPGIATIINSIGCIVETSKITSGEQTLIFANVPNGIYYIKIQSGDISRIVKLIKQ